jgi:hypothetical protein
VNSMQPTLARSTLATAIAAALFLTACGGGGDASAPTAQASAALTTPAADEASTPTERTKQLSSLGARELFDWAQIKYPDILSGAFTDFPLDYQGISFSVRSIPGKNAYLGLSANGEVFALAPFTNNALQSYGPLSGFSAQVDADLCAIGHPSCSSPGVRAWQSAQLLELSNDFNVAGENTFSDVRSLSAIAPNGNAMVMWEQSDGSPDGNTRKVFSRRYVSGVGWDAAVAVPGVSTSSSSVALLEGYLLMDAAGNATWIRPNTETRRFTPASGWGSPFLAPSISPGGVSTAVMDANGNIFALTSGGDVVLHNVLAAGGNWGAWTRIDASGNLAAQGARLALSTNGTRMAVWREQNPGDNNYSVKAARYTVATGWQTPVSIETGFENVSRDSGVRVGMDAAGNAIAIWHQGNSIYYNGSNAAGAWGTATQVDNGNVSSTSVARLNLSVSSDGRAVMAWNSGLFAVKALQYSPTEGVTAPVVVAPYSIDRSLNLDDNGNVVMVYRSPSQWPNPSSGTFNIYSRRLAWGGIWSDQLLLESSDGDTKGSVATAFNKSGQGVASWAQNDVVNVNVRNSLWANVLR